MVFEAPKPMYLFLFFSKTGSTYQEASQRKSNFGLDQAQDQEKWLVEKIRENTKSLWAGEVRQGNVSSCVYRKTGGRVEGHVFRARVQESMLRSHWRWGEWWMPRKG